MSQTSTQNAPNCSKTAISPFIEMGAYEALWDKAGATFKRLSERFANSEGSVPSDFVHERTAKIFANKVIRRFEEAKIKDFGVRVHGAGEYPPMLRDAKYPIEMLYYQGWWDLINTRSVAVVGTRNPSREGLARTRRIVRCLIDDDFTIVSGLASGVDRAAHQTALDRGGRTIAVMGTPLHHTYPRENSKLRDAITSDFLIISQVPVERYERQDYRANRGFFPERNKTMSALTEATIIVEAGETSGTLIQAQAAFEQGRKLFILDSCFKNRGLTWPQKFADRGAIRVKDYDDIATALANPANKN